MSCKLRLARRRQAHRLLVDYQELAQFEPCRGRDITSHQSGQFPISKFGEATVTSGLPTYAYAPNKTLSLQEWPTVQELIDDGHRFIVFLDCGANTSVVQYILDQLTYFFETSSSETDLKFPNCDLSHLVSADMETRMFIMNHMLHAKIRVIEVQDREVATVTN